METRCSPVCAHQGVHDPPSVLLDERRGVLEVFQIVRVDVELDVRGEVEAQRDKGQDRAQVLAVLPVAVSADLWARAQDADLNVSTTRRPSALALARRDDARTVGAEP